MHYGDFIGVLWRCMSQTVSQKEQTEHTVWSRSRRHLLLDAACPVCLMAIFFRLRPSSRSLTLSWKLRAGHWNLCSATSLEDSLPAKSLWLSVLSTNFERHARSPLGHYVFKLKDGHAHLLIQTSLFLEVQADSCQYVTLKKRRATSRGWILKHLNFVRLVSSTSNFSASPPRNPTRAASGRKCLQQSREVVPLESEELFLVDDRLVLISSLIHPRINQPQIHPSRLMWTLMRAIFMYGWLYSCYRVIGSGSQCPKLRPSGSGVCFCSSAVLKPRM